MTIEELGDLLTPGEVAALFRVDPKTVARWAAKGPDGEPPLLTSVRTPGGHHRYRRRDLEEYFRKAGYEGPQSTAQDQDRREEDQGPAAAGEG